MFHLNIILCVEAENIRKFCLAYGLCMPDAHGLYTPSNSTPSATDEWKQGRREVLVRDHVGRSHPLRR